MEIISIILAFLTGLFGGLSLILYFWLKQSEIERKLLINKVLVRDGQARIFTDAMIAGETTEKPPQAPFEMKSPFRAGIQTLKSAVTKQKRVESGSNLPDVIKEKIEKAAMEAKNGQSEY